MANAALVTHEREAIHSWWLWALTQQSVHLVGTSQQSIHRLLELLVMLREKLSLSLSLCLQGQLVLGETSSRGARSFGAQALQPGPPCKAGLSIEFAAAAASDLGPVLHSS